MGKSIKILIMILCPILGSLIIFLENKIKKYDCFILSVFMGYLGYFFIPYIGTDNGSHYDTFKLIKNFNIIMLLDFFKNKVDIGLYSIMFFFGKIGLSYYAMVFFLVFIGYRNYFKSYQLLKINKKIFFCLFFINIPFYTLAFGIRNGIALSFVFYSICCFENNKKKKAIILMICAILFHIMTIFYMLFFFIKIKKEKTYRLLLLLSIFIGIFLIRKEVIGNVLEYLKLINISKALEYKINVYLEKQFGVITTVTTTKGYIFEEIRRIITIYFPLFYVVLTNGKLKYRKYIYGSLIIYFLFLHMETINYRYSILILYFTLFSYFEEYKKKYLVLVLILTLIWGGACFFKAKDDYYQILLKAISNNILILPLVDLTLIKRM